MEKKKGQHKPNYIYVFKEKYTHTHTYSARPQDTLNHKQNTFNHTYQFYFHVHNSIYDM